MKLEELQNELKYKKIDAYIIGHDNRFCGQDILDSEHRLKAVCGFSGSAGMLAVTKNNAYLFVDGRYELQARQEVDLSRVEVINQLPQLDNVCELLMQKCKCKIGYDAWCFTGAQISALQRNMPDLRLYEIDNLLQLDSKDEVEVLERPLEYAGQSSSEKLEYVKALLKHYNADYYLFTSADSVSWLLNIYAHDLPYSPVVRAYALISAWNEVLLIGDNLKTSLPTKSFADFYKWLQEAELAKILYDDMTIPQKIKIMLPICSEPVPDICRIQKAQKNATELKGMIASHWRDGVAMVKLLYWLENNWRGKTELDVVKKLHELRKQQDLYFSESFATIAGSAENGAIVHYSVNEKTNHELKENNLLLLDSGGQYLDGTTDVTRTIAIGEPSTELIHDFTLVLKAHIGLARARFPVGTLGVKLDTLARSKMWQEGKDYKHGTGHGVACFGNVHEGPINIGVNGSMYGFNENMVTSIEPGFYKENAYGIRIENLAYTKKDKMNFLSFVPLTLVPIDKKLIDKYMLDAGEQDWLNEYHQMVFERLVACVNDDEKKWLKESCSPL